jgi:hypothetical protein
MDFIEELIVDEDFVARKDTYNMKTGGQNGKPLESPFKGKHHSEESRRKLSEANKGHTGFWKGKHLSEEARKKISMARKGKPTCLGRPRTEEQKRRQSEAMKGRHPWNYGQIKTPSN